MTGGIFDIRRLFKAFGFSLLGLRAAIRTQPAFRQALVLVAALAALGLWLGRDGAERALLVGSAMLILVSEMFNCAIEVTVDRIGREHHELSGRAKDMASAAQLLTLCLVATVWAIVLVVRFCG